MLVLSLAYDIEINDKLINKSLAIEPRGEYKEIRPGLSEVFDHNFEDCVIKSWNNFLMPKKILKN